MNKVQKFALTVSILLATALTTATAQVWDGTADTTWYTNNKDAAEYTITTPQQLAGLARLVNGSEENGTYNMGDKTIMLGNDIVLNDTENWQNWGTTPPANSWVAIGTGVYNPETGYSNSFQGTFDGNGHVVSGVYINNSSDSYQGLFGYSLIIKNIGVVDSYIKGGYSVGGLTGYNAVKIINSYFIGTVTTTVSNFSGYAGGLVGYNQGLVINSYSIGKVTATTTGVNIHTGGLVGSTSSGSVSNSYYNVEISGQTDTGKGVGKTTIGMQSQEFAYNLNICATIQSMNAWVYSEGKYPVLKNTFADMAIDISSYFASGNGTEVNPYIIITKEQLENLSFLVNSGMDFFGEYFKLGNDIALNGDEDNHWLAIGNNVNSFQGTFDGDGHVIGGVYINNAANFQGLFGCLGGYLGDRGTIKNLGIVNSYIKGGGSYIGGLVGRNDQGTVSNSYFTGTVVGSSSYIGGLVGANDRGVISNSYSAGTVTGNQYVGGLVGQNDQGTVSNSYSTSTVTRGSTAGSLMGGLVGVNNGVISNSYSTGAVTAGSYIGGLVGGNNSTISNSYSIGTVTTVTGSNDVGGLVGYNNSTISNSYYDKTISGQTDTEKGEGKTTADMKEIETYVDWDFQNTWGKSETKNNGYPYLFPKRIPTTADLVFTIPTNHIYTGTSQGIGAVTTDAEGMGEITVVYLLYYYGTYISSDVPTNAGTYAVKINIAEGKNFEAAAIELGEYVIAKADYNMIGISFEDKMVTYDGSYQSIEITGELPLGVSVSYDCECSYNAGEYTVRAVFTNTNSTNYNDPSPSEMTATLKIEKATPEYDIPTNLTVKYGDLLSSFGLPNSYYGYWIWEGTGTVGDVGTQTHKATFTPFDTQNYNVVTGIDISITVEPADTDPIISNRENPSIGGIGVQTASNAIMLTNLPPNAKVEVYNLNGKRVYSDVRALPATPRLSIPMQTRGIYIVKVGNQTMRVAVR